jgi:hypothetical protein
MLWPPPVGTVRGGFSSETQPVKVRRGFSDEAPV